jgi:hypothetical protein
VNKKRKEAKRKNGARIRGKEKACQEKAQSAVDALL